MKCLRNLLILLILVAGGFIAYIYSGAYGVNATGNNWAPIDWVFRTVSEHSIRAAAAGVTVPDNLADASRIREGAKGYAAMCAGCHLAPGKKKSEIRKGLNPRPPQLDRIAQYIEPKEAFWVIKNGIRNTAMPAWGVSHSDDDIWNLVAFVKTLPQTSPERYQALTQGAKRQVEQEPHHGAVPEAPAPIATPSTHKPPRSLTPPQPATQQPPSG